MKRIQIWQDGPLEADPMFSEHLADKLPILDDDSLWEKYTLAREQLSELNRQILERLRPPTEEEAEEYRNRVRAHLIECKRNEDE